jgi:hypothetical protein
VRLRLAGRETGRGPVAERLCPILAAILGGHPSDCFPEALRAFGLGGASSIG